MDTHRAIGILDKEEIHSLDEVDAFLLSKAKNIFTSNQLLALELSFHFMIPCAFNRFGIRY